VAELPLGVPLGDAGLLSEYDGGFVFQVSKG
jgi:hypothetical protein